MGLLIIARDNIKKKKSNTIILFLLVALASMLLYVGISLLTNIEKVIDRRNNAQNGADYVLVTTSAFQNQIRTILEEQPGVKAIEQELGVDAVNLKYYHENETEADAQQLEFIFYSKDNERYISVPNIIDEGLEWKSNSIILPYYMKAGMNYKTGETIHMVYNKKHYDFEVYGFTEDIMFANPSNVPMEKCYVNNDIMDDLKQDWIIQNTMYRVSLDDQTDCAEFEDTTTKVLNQKISDFNYSQNMVLNYSSMKQGASVTVNIFVGILTVFSLLLIIISMVIIHFNINNTIEMNIKNIGVLESIGYRTQQLQTANFIEFLLVSVLGIIVGLISAIGAGKFIGNILSSSIGLVWDIKFDWLSAIVSAMITLSLVCLTVWLSSMKYHRISSLDALRNGIHVHNFRKNRIPLAQSKLSLNVAMGVKNIMYY